VWEPLQLYSHQRVLLVLQTGVPGEGVNSSCNLGNAASATAAPRSRKPTHIGTINASVEGELLLRQPAVHPDSTQIPRDQSPPTHPCCGRCAGYKPLAIDVGVAG
jgi:hypothetical protein